VFAWRSWRRHRRYEFGWFDRLLDRLAAHGLAADLTTATA
jgi:hypothetical protein